MAEAPDDDKIYDLVLHRIYHEDSLLAQRTANFVATHAFLAAALALSIPSASTTNYSIPYVVAYFGLILALFHIPLGHRSQRAIQFFRVYLRGIEKRRIDKPDSLLFDFYSDGEVKTRFGTISGEDKQKPMMKVFPWCIPYAPSTNVWVGVWTPSLVTIFWAAALICIHDGIPRNIAIGVVAALGAATLLLILTKRISPREPRLMDD